MDKHGRLTEDYAHLRHHTALTGERLSPQQRKDNADYNAAVRARSEMLDSYGPATGYVGNGSVSKASVKHAKRKANNRTMNLPRNPRDGDYSKPRLRGPSHHRPWWLEFGGNA